MYQSATSCAATQAVDSCSTRMPALSGDRECGYYYDCCVCTDVYVLLCMYGCVYGCVETFGIIMLQKSRL